MIFRHTSAKRRAAFTVEAAIVLPIFFLILFGIFEYARFLFTVEILNHAAREGARYAVVNTTTASTTNVQNYVDHYLAGQGVQLQNYTPSGNISVFQADPNTGASVGSNWQATPVGQPIGVQITGTYTPLLGKLLFMGSLIPVKATCVMYSESN